MQARKCLRQKFILLFALLIAVIIQFLVCCNVFADEPEPDPGNSGTEPGQEQQQEPQVPTEHFEMIARTGTNEGQIIFELWGYDIDFNGYAVRFTWDSSKYSTSNISTNEVTTNASEYFEFNSDSSYDPTISSLLDYQALAYDVSGIGIRAMVTFNPPVNIGGLVIDKGDGKVLTTSGGVLIGTYSFKIKEGNFDISDFSIVTNEGGSLPTGVKIDLGLTDKYFESNRFVFIDGTASKDATLKSLLINNVDDETRKYLDVNNTIIEIPLEKDVTLMEYIDKVNLTAVRNEENATMKIKFPVKDAEGTVTYSEEDLVDGTPFEITINKLGEEDTELTITVTAEDGKTEKEYKVIIKRPFATLKGSLKGMEVNATTSNNDAEILVYNQEKLYEEVDLNTYIGKTMDDLNSKLRDIPSDVYYEVDQEGIYSIFVIPGTYSILIDKIGYLDLIYIDVTVEKNDEKDFGEAVLDPGDVNKDGAIQIRDKNTVVGLNGKLQKDSEYTRACDFNNDGAIQIKDKNTVIQNNGKARKIISYK